MKPRLTCANSECKASAKDTSKEPKRFLARHPKRCMEYQLRQAAKAVNDGR